MSHYVSMVKLSYHNYTFQVWLIIALVMLSPFCVLLMRFLIAFIRWIQTVYAVIWSGAYISSVESQKGVIAAQRCSVENQKGAIAVQNQWQ